MANPETSRIFSVGEKHEFHLVPDAVMRIGMGKIVPRKLESIQLPGRRVIPQNTPQPTSSLWSGATGTRT
jgi:hypothetical protein